jgi:O-antigen/teichoic acid export membrane protein
VSGDPTATGNEHAERRSLRSVARNLTLVNLVYTGASVVTSPLQAHALGPDGRGELAAVTVVLGLVAMMGDFGLSAYSIRESSRGRKVSVLLGSIGPQLLLLGCFWAALAPWLASAVADGRGTVETLLLIGLLSCPLLIPSTLTTGIVWGQQRWALYAIQRLTLPLGTLVVFPILYVLDSLTVMSAGLTMIGFSLLGHVPAYRVLKDTGKLRRDRTVAREARSYGRRVWISQLANLTNGRLDQLLMTQLVPSAELGYYVVALNFSLLQTAFTSAVATALLPRVAAGNSQLIGRALRGVLIVIVPLGAGLFVTVPYLLPLIFGRAFAEAVLMCQILVCAAIPLALVHILTTTLNAINRPGIAAKGEVLSLLITVPGLVLFVGNYGGVAAATVSGVAYSATAMYLATHVRRSVGGTWADLLVPRRRDVALLSGLWPRR